MPRKKELTFEEHLELAKKIQIIRDNVTDILIKCEKHFNRNNPIVYNAMALMHSKHFSKLQSLLDDEYCKKKDGNCFKRWKFDGCMDDALS